MTKTMDDKRDEYVIRDNIMKLLSDGEIGSISTVETKSHLLDGDDYLDFEHLDYGVQRATAAAAPLGRLLPKKSVREKTWNKILRRLVLSGITVTETGG